MPEIPVAYEPVVAETRQYHKRPTTKMASLYDVSTYLLDKEGIRDTIIRMLIAYDERDTSTLIHSVYAPEITLNYDARLGGHPETVPSEQWAKRLEHMHDGYDTTQHIIQNVLINLPQPGTEAGASRPESCTVVAYAHGLFYKRNIDGMPRTMALRSGVSFKMLNWLPVYKNGRTLFQTKLKSEL